MVAAAEIEELDHPQQFRQVNQVIVVLVGTVEFVRRFAEPLP